MESESQDQAFPARLVGEFPVARDSPESKLLFIQLSEVMATCESFCRGVLLGFVVTFAATQSRAQFNSWTNLSSAQWEHPYWSLGVLPDANQTVAITNAGYKAVGIFTSTAASFPSSMTVSNLALAAPQDAQLTLLLNHVGTAVPLQVLNECGIGSNATLLNLYSALEVQGTGRGLFRIDSGRYTQEGGRLAVSEAELLGAGSMELTNATAELGSLNFGAGSGTASPTLAQSGGNITGKLRMTNGTYSLRGGVFSGTLEIGSYGIAAFDHHAGTNTGQIRLGTGVRFGPSAWGRYRLYSGLVSNEFLLVGGPWSGGIFDQHDGLVVTGLLGIGGVESSCRYNLTNGILKTEAVDFIYGGITQAGGRHTTASAFSITGSFDDYNSQNRRFTEYQLHGGVLEVPGISMSLFGSFDQTGGTNLVQGDLSYTSTSYNLTQGLLSTSNTWVRPLSYVTSDGVRIHSRFEHSGGIHLVHDTLTIDGIYTLSGGTVIATNVQIKGSLLIGNSPGLSTLSNSALLQLGGRLALHSSVVSFGKLLLLTNVVQYFWDDPVAVLDLSGSSKAVFKSSSDVAWAEGSLLVVSNWAGATAGGGVCQFVVGVSEAGLRPDQLTKIQFIDPAGFEPGAYTARILPTGEVVPSLEATLSVSVSGTNIILVWPGGLRLQGATNLAGPYSDIRDYGFAFSPYAESIGVSSRFFRLRR